MVVAVIGRFQRGGRRPARGDGHAEGAPIRTQYLWPVERLEKVEPAQVGLATPGRQETVGPDDRVVFTNQRDAVRQVLEDRPGGKLPGQTLVRGGRNWIRHQRHSAHRLPVGSLLRKYKIRWIVRQMRCRRCRTSRQIYTSLSGGSPATAGEPPASDPVSNSVQRGSL